MFKPQLLFNFIKSSVRPFVDFFNNIKFYMAATGEGVLQRLGLDNRVIAIA